MNFSEFISSKPNLRYLFFGGKGGVGKTVVAAGAAQYFATRGKKTIISSTNPVHSLSSIFKTDIWGKGVQKLTENLYAIEFDISRTIEKYKADMKEKLLTFIKSADIPVDPDPFLDIATTNPAFEEAAMFDDMVNLILEDEFDVYVFDTAPVAHTYRLLGLSKVYDLWLKRLIKSREEALSLKVKLSFRKEKVIEEIKKDPVLQSALETRRRTEEAKKILTDREKTAFFFVTLPLALPIAVIERFITWVKAFDIPIGGVIVNGVLPKKLLRDEKLSSYVVNKLREQDGYLKMINEKFPNLVRAYIPLYETEVIGIDMVDKVASALANGGFNLV
ncbi:MAG: ArsA family ATPase [Thaumarchaeota archaeon]|jgi:arsenite-transporting ATPase|nr:ArsA family ATPase [Candidatus Geocrenenecus arthurdayi]MCL7396377.1 ArsA family ATPase [Candidatus Geocrenenecus arthurdayi]